MKDQINAELLAFIQRAVSASAWSATPGPTGARISSRDKERRGSIEPRRFCGFEQESTSY
jgi:hypothetical protein